MVSQRGIAHATTRAIVAEAGMSLASFHYAFDSRDELIDELITTVVAREQEAVLPDDLQGHDIRDMLEAGRAALLRPPPADPEHEQAMLELTQYALRSPDRHPLAVAQYARYTELGARSLTAAAELAGVVWTTPVERGRTGAHRLHRRAHPHVARHPRRRRRTRGRTRGRRRPFENGRAPMTSLDSAPHQAQPTTAALGEPVRRVSAGWIASFATVWLGIWMAQLTPVQLLLPAQIDAQLKPDNWVDSVVAFGIISGIAAIATIIAYPLTGALSDRTTSRFGRRRPWIAIGAVVFAPLARRARASRPRSGRSARRGSRHPSASAS